VSFSIPINLVKRIVRELLEKGSVSRGYLGMHLATSFEATDAERLGLDRAIGAWVDKVYPDTPAAQAGLRTNDVVLQVDGVTIRNENHFINLVSDMAPGRRVKLQVWRDRRTIALDAVSATGRRTGATATVRAGMNRTSPTRQRGVRRPRWRVGLVRFTPGRCAPLRR